jgi:DNA-binding LacI/PurR family transcriptional regulator
MILQAANEANYIPSSARRFGAESCHKRYYILFESNYAEQGSFFSELILSIQRELFADGASCFLGNIDGGYPEFLKLFNIMQAEDLAGVFIVGGAPVEHINAVLAGFPNVVLVDNPGDVRLGRPYNAVVFDNRAGCYLAVNHLLILGRRRILMACGPEQHYFSREMLLGYESAHQNAGVLFLSVPAPEVVCTVAGIQHVLKIYIQHIPYQPIRNCLLYGGNIGSKPVVEGDYYLLAGACLCLKDGIAFFGIYGHRLFCNYLCAGFQTLYNIFVMKPVYCGNNC